MHQILTLHLSTIILLHLLTRLTHTMHLLYLLYCHMCLLQTTDLHKQWRGKIMCRLLLLSQSLYCPHPLLHVIFHSNSPLLDDPILSHKLATTLA
jgi:hypothetical protein